MHWKAFTRNEVVYSLDHLHPFSFELVVPATDGKQERRYKINVQFSLHCFTRSLMDGEEISSDLAYSDNRETRFFDEERYRQSSRLPDIVRSLDNRSCFHDAHGNFYVFEVVETDGSKSYYSVFFTLSKAGKKAGLNLFISSAHMRLERPYARNKKPIGFRVLVHNTWIGKGVRPPP